MVMVCIKFISLRKIVHSYLAHEIIALFHGDFCEGTKNWAENLDRSKLLFFWKYGRSCAIH
jgi:hypothetical protein